MAGKLARSALPLGAAVIVFGAATPALGVGIPDPGPVVAGQYFTGLVNGHAGPVRIAVSCDDQGGSVPTGHPAAGQTLQVLPLPRSATPTAEDGFTGTDANEIDVALYAPRNTPLTVFRFYQVTTQIPTTIPVPCSGTYRILFAPAPASAASRPAISDVTFVAVP